MPRRSLPARLPPIWLVLVPLAVLAWLGLRAAANESDAARTRAAARADAAAQRLVRSIDTVAREFAGGLPAADVPTSPGDALDSARHLSPRHLTDADGRPLSDDGATEPAVPDADRALVADALDAADRLGDDAAGLEARAVFLQSAADLVGSAGAVRALRLTALAAQRTLAPGPVPDEAVAAFEDVAADAGGFGDAIRDRLVAAWDRADAPDEIRRTAEMWDTVRAAAREAGDTGLSVVRLVPRAGDVGILVVAPITLVTSTGTAAACVAGEVPSATVRSRIAEEARALIEDPALVLVEIVAPDGTAPIFAESEGAPGAARAATPVETWVTLPAPLEAWHVHVIAGDDAADTTLAAVLVGTVVLAVGALAWGAFAMQRATREQARLAAERQSFLDHVAHEVRTPAGALLALSEELAAGHVAPERQAKYHAHLAEESRRLARLVEDTLDLSRLDAGRLVFEKAETDLRGVVAEGLRAAGAEDRVAFRAPTAPVTVRIDAAAVRRVVRNLADNAMRHGAADAASVAKPKPDVTVSCDATSARVVVRDHGPGIAADEIPRLFERFRRPSSETHETKGVGVGLAICREIARAHGGDVTVTSEPGKGAAFTLTLPRDGGGHA